MCHPLFIPINRAKIDDTSSDVFVSFSTMISSFLTFFSLFEGFLSFLFTIELSGIIVVYFHGGKSDGIPRNREVDFLTNVGHFRG